jgi:hypothetical protein
MSIIMQKGVEGKFTLAQAYSKFFLLRRERIKPFSQGENCALVEKATIGLDDDSLKRRIVFKPPNLLNLLFRAPLVEFSARHLERKLSSALSHSK